MLAGTPAAGEWLKSCTSTPPVGAGWLRVRVPVELLPAATVPGFIATDVTQRSAPSDGITVTGALALELP